MQMGFPDVSQSRSMGVVIELEGLYIQLPEKPDESEILFSNLPASEQYWKRQEIPSALQGIRSMGA